ncbi:MAG: gamma-glutamyltransferase family protein [Pseudomonadota bacterium]
MPRVAALSAACPRAVFRALAALVLATAALAPPPGGARAQEAEAARATPEAESGRRSKPLVEAQRHMIVAAHPLASAAGLEMLRAGGSAADAAIATLLALNVVEPQSSGLGGGGFALVHGPKGLTSYDARETAPRVAGPDLFLERGEPMGFWDAVASGRSVGVPGLGRLMETLHTRHGRLAWARLFEPAIRLAEEGFRVTPRLATLVAGSSERLAASHAAALFLPDGVPIAEGALLRQPRLAQSLRLIAAEGADVLYGWPLGAAIISATRTGRRPGALGLADLEGYRVIERSAVCHRFRAGWRVCGMGPPSSGATTVGQILGLAAAFAPPPDAASGAHIFAEASRLAYADRALYLADPDQVSVPVVGLLDRGYLATRARLINPGQASTGPAAAGTPPLRSGHLLAPDTGRTRPGTTHLSVVDGDGLAISLTASIETAFGSGRMAGGFLLNNQLTDFSFRPVSDDGRAIANAPAAGKRPRSSMAPTIVYASDAPGTPRILIGSPGGSRIPEYVAGALRAMLDAGADPAAAAARAHVSHRNRGALALEAGAHPATLAPALEALGHEVTESAMTSGLHIIEILPDGRLRGGADPRRDGIALGD